MGHQKLRTDKTCLNCNYVVENKYCPNCGQENTETRQSFHYLFSHFIEDLTHYDGSFWKTIKYLLLRPGYLTKEYLQGKRKKFVPPVKLYIFISFVTFLLPSVLPDISIFGNTKENTVTSKNESSLTKKEEPEKLEISEGMKIKNLKELDSIQNTVNKISYVEYGFYKNLLKANEEKDKKEFWEKAIESFVHTLPKVLFIYMPIFAFFLWLFHDKKKWYYFDSGVFTLHYFSLLLLVITIGILFKWVLRLIHYVDEIADIFDFVSMAYCFFYFFRSHSRFFGESKAVSRLKSILLFVINMFLIFVFSLALFIYSMWQVH